MKTKLSPTQNIKKLITNHTRRLQKLKEEQALEGITTDPKILLEIEDIEGTLQILEAELKELESGVLMPPPTPSIQTKGNNMAIDIIQIYLPEQETVPTEEKQNLLLKLIAEALKIKMTALHLHLNHNTPTWVGLELTKHKAQTLIKRFDDREFSLYPLKATIHNSLIIEKSLNGINHFKPMYEFLIKQLYLGYKKVMIKKAVGGGLGGALVVLIQPTNQNNLETAPHIVKIGLEAELKQEWFNAKQLIEPNVPFASVKAINKTTPWRGIMAMSYNFAGGGNLGETNTLEEYYKKASSTEIIKILEKLLHKTLGQAWQKNFKTDTCHFSKEYGQHLVEHLRLKLDYDADEWIWLTKEAPPIQDGYMPVQAENVVTLHQSLSTGKFVQITGLQITKIKRKILKLQHAKNPGIVVKVDYEDRLLPFKKGDEVVVCGEVIYNRHDQLLKIAKKIFTNFSELPQADMEIEQSQLSWGQDNTPYPNPLHIYSTILEETFSRQCTWVHGDLHLRNILVDENKQAFLIDFAKVKERHNLFDFIKLETYIRQWILGKEDCQFSFTEYLQFEEALTLTTLGQMTSPPANTNLQKAYEVIQAIREIAKRYMGPHSSFKEEYLPGLFLYSLAMLKYLDNHGRKAGRLAFGTAQILGTAILHKEIPPFPFNINTKTHPITDEKDEDKEKVTESTTNTPPRKLNPSSISTHTTHITTQKGDIIGPNARDIHIGNNYKADKMIFKK